jgi:hypothetical protein
MSIKINRLEEGHNSYPLATDNTKRGEPREQVFGVVCCLPFSSTCFLGSPRLVLSVAYPSQAPVLWVLPVWCCLSLTLRKHLFSGCSSFGVVCCLPFAITC